MGAAGMAKAQNSPTTAASTSTAPTGDGKINEDMLAHILAMQREQLEVARADRLSKEEAANSARKREEEAAAAAAQAAKDAAAEAAKKQAADARQKEIDDAAELQLYRKGMRELGLA